MPIDVSIDTDQHLVTRIVRDPVTFDEYIQSLESVLTHPDYHPGMKSLTDLRDAPSHQASSEDIRRIAQFLTKSQEQHGRAKAALVVSKTVIYGLSRMLQIYLEAGELPLEISVFYDPDEAKQWLGVT